MLAVEVSTPSALMDALQSPSPRIRGEGARDLVVHRGSGFSICKIISVVHESLLLALMLFMEI